jgi:hypothetical protein
MKLKKEIFKYIETNTNWEIEDKELHISLPLYIKSGYELWNSSIAGFGVLFARVKEPKVGMPIHYNAIKKIEDLYPCHVVLVFDYLDSRSINRLINKHVPFVIKDKQIYMPFALMQMQTNKSSTKALRKAQDLTPDADTILVGYLDNRFHNEIMIKDIASIIDREARATSIALALLESLEYLRIEKYGRSKIVYFISKEEIYDRLKDEGKSPVKYVFYTDSKLLNEYAIASGYSALGKFSTLMNNSLPSIAISSKKLSLVASTNIACEKEDAEYQVEVWNRDPFIFSVNGSVNPLYILRILKGEYDERTEYALDDLEEKIIKNFKG